MPTPKPWSFSSIDNFQTCPRQYYYKYVLKQYHEEPSKEQLWGTRVHKSFEDYVRDGTPLLPELNEHKEYLDKLRGRDGEVNAEQKVALNIRCQPTGYYSPDVWWRGIIDYQNKDGDVHRIVDYKTGKMKPKLLQLHLAMLYSFAQGAEMVEAEFYWTQHKVSTKITFPRFHSASILRGIKPLVSAYAEAWIKDIWQPRPSGLCRGWCAVTDCEFHGRGK